MLFRYALVSSKPGATWEIFSNASKNDFAMRQKIWAVALQQPISFN